MGCRVRVTPVLASWPEQLPAGSSAQSLSMVLPWLVGTWSQALAKAAQVSAARGPEHKGDGLTSTPLMASRVRLCTAQRSVMDRRTASTLWLSSSASGADGPVTSTPAAATGGAAASPAPAVQGGRAEPRRDRKVRGKAGDSAFAPAVGTGPSVRALSLPHARGCARLAWTHI